MENEKEYLVQVRNLNKSFGDNRVLENLNISFEKNKITVVTGPSGCGKTTLLNIISGIEKPDSGEVILKDHSISYIFQEDRLLPDLTVYRNIEFVLKSTMTPQESKPIIEKYLGLVKLASAGDKYPDQLSGGMKRRVAVARAFAYRSDLLIMDEPFKGLDDKLKMEIMEEFLRIYRLDKRTVILVTHDMDEARFLGDTIIELKAEN
ncbi:MAG: transporter related protein [Firmicutes bacterium]|nr:transporter related protein [Bacillota bacterium]